MLPTFGNLQNIQLRPGSLTPQTTYEPRDPVPEGEYQAVIVKSEARVSRAGNRYVTLAFCVIDGPHQGREIYTNLNLTNHNDWAVQLGHARLKAICDALGMEVPHDTSAFHFQPLTIRVRHRLRKDLNRMVADIVDYSPPDPKVAEVYRQQLTRAQAHTPTPQAPAPAPQAHTPAGQTQFPQFQTQFPAAARPAVPPAPGVAAQQRPSQPPVGWGQFTYATATAQPQQTEVEAVEAALKEVMARERMG